MTKRLQVLEEWGCDIASSLPRLLGDEALLETCIVQVAIDSNFDDLGQALKRQDAVAAFHAAHTLKGIIANTGLTPLYGLICDVIEPLRASLVEEESLMRSYTHLMEKREELNRILADFAPS